MKIFSALLILLSALLAPAAVPEYQRNAFTTNLNPAALNVVTQIVNAIGGSPTGAMLRVNNGSDAANKRVFGTNAGIAYLSPVGGNDAVGDMMRAGATYEGQMAISYSGGAKYPAIWFARSTTGTGTNVWGTPVSFPGGLVGDQGPSWMTVPGVTANGQNITFNFNGSPTLSANSNRFSESYMFVGNRNPFSSGSSFGLQRFMTNQFNGAGTPGSVIGTNIDGVPIYYWLYEGLQFVSIPDGYNVGESNQAPCNTIIPGTSFPFYISFNTSYGGDGLNQRAMFALDTRGWTNLNMPLVGGFPQQVAYAWALTNRLYRWTLAADERDGYVYITNNAAVVTNLWINGTNSNSLVVGKGFEGADNIPMKVNGSAQFNSVNNLTGFMDAWTFDAAGADRLGFMIQSGQYPKLVHASGAPMIFARSSGSDLQTSISGQTVTDEMVIQANGAGVTNSVPVNNGSPVTNWAATYLRGGAFDANGSGFIPIQSGAGNANTFTNPTVITNLFLGTRSVITNNDATTNVFIGPVTRAGGVTIGPGGNVGIGTNNPAFPFQINVSATSPISFGRDASFPTYGAISLNNTMSDSGMIGFFGGGDSHFFFNSPSNIILRPGGTANSALFRATLNGLILGGTGGTDNNASNRLEVAGSVAIGSYAQTVGGPANGLIVSGNVGIGTTMPLFTEHVVGSLYVTNGAILQAFTVAAPTAPLTQGAAYWNDGTNVCVVLRNGAGTLTTNKLTLAAWP